jgi:hypothetical protein
MGQDIERAAESLEALYGSGGLSEESKDALLAVSGAALEIGRGLGDPSSAQELLLASILVDDSPSVAPNVAEIRFGHQLMLDALTPKESVANVQVLTRLLNRGILSPYRSIVQAIPLSSNNFSGSTLLPWTPLYLQSLLTLGTVVAKAHEEEREHQVKVRTFTLIITDGEDNKSGSISASHVRALVKDMLEFSTNHIVAGMGVGERVDFHQVFRSMGVPKRWIFTSDANVNDLRSKFSQIARSLALAASSETAFHQLAPGPESDGAR